MKKSTSWLLVFIAAAMFSAVPSTAAGADSSYLNTEYSPGTVVLSLAFPSNSERQWSIDFSGRSSAASDWMVRNLTGGMEGVDSGFTIINGGYELTHEQAYQAIVGSTRGTVVQAWADIANAYESPDLGFTDGTGRVTLWDKILFTLDGLNFIHTPGYGVYMGELLFGTPYLHNLHTITGVGFASSVDSAVMNVSGVSNQVIGKRLGELRSGGNKKTGFWTSPFATVHKEGERNGYAPFRYKANGGALGYDKAFGAFTVGGAAFYSRGRYDDKWSLDNGQNASDHYGLSVYGNWYATENLFLNAHAGYQHSRNTIRRRLIGAAGDYLAEDWLGTKNSAGTWWLAAKAGYDFDFLNNFTVTTSIGLEYRRAGNNGFTVSDSLGAPFMEFERLKRSAFSMPADLSVQYRRDIGEACSMTLRAGGGYTREFITKGAEGTMHYAGMSHPVAILGAKSRSGDWNVHLGAKFALCDRWELGAEYRREGSGSYGYTGSFSVTF